MSLPSLQMLHSIFAWIASSLRSDTNAIVALASLVTPMLLLLTQIRDFYGDTIGYGLSVTLQALFLQTTFAPNRGSIGFMATCLAMIYGIRLACYLFIRDQMGWRPQTPEHDLPRILRIPESFCLALFYAFLTSPLYYLLLSQPVDDSLSASFSWMGFGISAVGLLLEAYADAQKFALKRNRMKPGVIMTTIKGTRFAGPTNGAYALCRHPNYAGEVLYWFGTWLTGISSCLQSSFKACACATLGLVGITSVVIGVALRHTEQKQAMYYKGQNMYEQWKQNVTSPIVPFISMSTTPIPGLKLW